MTNSLLVIPAQAEMTYGYCRSIRYFDLRLTYRQERLLSGQENEAEFSATALAGE